MANETIYPYGQGGSIPSGYPIADDLMTNDAQNALSARQGTIIRPYIMDTYDAIDLTSLTRNDYSLGSNGWYVTGKHIVIPVTPGDELNITVQGVSGSDGGWYAYFTSAYTPPASTSDTIPYVAGTSRYWQNTGTAKRTVPANAAYLCLCTKDGGGDKTWQASELVTKSSLVSRSEIVDSLSSTKTDAPLSANQGRVLAETIQGDKIPAGLTKYDYDGALVETKTKTHKVASGVVTSIGSIACQGGACFGDYLFMFAANNDTCWMYNLSSGTLVQQISIPSDQRGFVSNCHSNTVNFGTEYYDSNDAFPLIYVSTGYSSGGYTGALVYRILATTESDVTTYSLVLVQTLKMPTTPSSWTEFVIGDDGNCYICYTSIRRIYRMKLPKRSAGDTIFDLDDALEVYNFTPQPFSSDNQNRIYHNGKIYVVSGPANAGLFFVLDLATRTREAIVDLKAMGLTWEPETCFFWDNKLCIAFRSHAGVNALYFE